MFIKEFEVRWNDLDANRHLANVAYAAYGSHTRMSFLIQQGFNHKVLNDYNIGPVIFYEHIYYFKEVFGEQPIRVSLELEGLSEDYMFFEFSHNFYNAKGENLAHIEIMGAWMDLKKRKLTVLQPEIAVFFDNAEKPETFKILTKEDTRKYAKKPVNLEV